ncbi:MAG: hypothetical protein ABJK11_12700 [Balneola sp.]
MKKLILLLILFFSSHIVLAQNSVIDTPEAYRDSTQGFNFEINYWFNLHHFLWIEAFMATEMDSTIIDRKLSVESKRILNRALDYYKENLAHLDPRRDHYMSEFKSWITTEGKQLTSVPLKFQEHAEVLKEVSDVYKEFFWPIQKETSEEVLNENIELVRNTEAKFIERMTKLTRQFWQFERIKVDITYFGMASDWNPEHRAYTTIFPTHVVMKTEGEQEVKGNWLEILFHESTHHLILGSSYFVGGTIQDITEVLGIEAPRQLDHAYHFYLTGELTKQILEEEGISYDVTYMQREVVFSRYYSALDKYLKLYMNREMTLEETTRKIIAELMNNQP